MHRRRPIRKARRALRCTLGRCITQQGLETSFELQRRAEEVPVAEYLALARLQK